ncbi:MAG TPA: hypothetical protein VGV35_06990 [Bryobacteraceae bacterium]|nr:hypothetical protein [Bryobacteraceae bacterium]
MSTLLPKGVDFPKLDPCWLQAPPEGTPEFAMAFVPISMALQAALRKHLPTAYLESLERFRDVETTYSILVYQSSRVYRGKMRTDLTRDVMNPTIMARLVRMSRGKLIQKLVQVEARLRGEGLDQLALQYSRRRLKYIMKSVQRLRRSRRCLGVLVRGEGAMVDALVQLAGLGRRPILEQKQRVAQVKKKWISELRRMYPKKIFQDFAPLLLDAATQALRAYLESAPPSMDPGRESAQPRRNVLPPASL